MMKKLILFSGALWFATTLFSQDVRFGFQASPTFGWMGTNDPKINSAGTNVGLKLGLIGEFPFRENYGFFSGIGFHFNAGGSLRHETGGNFWTKSDLSDAKLNSSDLSDSFKPLPDGAELKYDLQYIEIPFGLKMRTQEMGYLRYYAEIPVITLGIATKARGSILRTASDVEGENIKPDVSILNLSWGFGGGVEYSLSSTTSLLLGLAYQRGFIDATSNKGYIATSLNSDGGTPDNILDDVYTTEQENSNGLLSGLTIRIGVLF